MCHCKVSSRKLVGHTNLGGWMLVLDVGLPLEELSHSSVACVRLEQCFGLNGPLSFQK